MLLRTDINARFDDGMAASQDGSMFEHNAPLRHYYTRSS
jgi:hypothetical protein